MKWWNPNTMQYEGAGAKIDVVASKIKSRSSNTQTAPSTQLAIFCYYSGTDGTVPVAAEVSRSTGIRIKAVGMCEIDETLRTKLKQRWINMPVLGDIKKLEENDVPDHTMLCASPPCQDFSTMGKIEGPAGKHSDSFPMTTEIMDWKRPIIACIKEVIGVLRWNGPGVHLPDYQEGSAFKRFRNRCDEINYFMYYTAIQLSQLDVPQYHDRRAYILGPGRSFS
jgi:DNA (cytosine-5)-methyltransferase 1